VIKVQSEHIFLSLTAGTSITAHDQKRHFALGIARIPLVDQRGVVTPERQKGSDR
jgi:hypothetical protein